MDCSPPPPPPPLLSASEIPQFDPLPYSNSYHHHDPWINDNNLMPSTDNIPLLDDRWIQNFVFDQPPPPSPPPQQQNQPANVVENNDLSWLPEPKVDANINSNNNELYSETEFLDPLPTSTSSFYAPSPPPPLLPPPPPLSAPVASTSGVAKSSPETKKNWSLHEHKLFLVGMRLYGKGSWIKIANKVVITKTHIQVASHAQKYFARQNLPPNRKRQSIHDINTFEDSLLLNVCDRLGIEPPTVDAAVDEPFSSFSKD